jgi:hypothetical protein
MSTYNGDHYFVVVAIWDDTAQRYAFQIDDDTLIARFPEGSIWNGDEYVEHEPANVDPTDWDLSLDLANTLDTYNLRAGE